MLVTEPPFMSCLPDCLSSFWISEQVVSNIGCYQNSSSAQSRKSVPEAICEVSESLEKLRYPHCRSYLGLSALARKYSM